jgi:hypothetical protein
VLDLQLAVRVLVDGQRVDDAYRVAFTQPFEFGDHLAVKVRVVEPENDELNRSDCHGTSLHSAGRKDPAGRDGRFAPPASAEP